MMENFAFSNDPYVSELEALKRRYEIAQQVANPKGVNPIIGALIGAFQRPKLNAIEDEFRELNTRRQNDRQSSMAKLAEVMAGPKRETPYVPHGTPQLDDEGIPMPGSIPQTMAANKMHQDQFGDRRSRIAQELLASKFPDIQQHGMKLLDRPAPKLNWQKTGNELIAFDESTGQVVNRMPLGESPDNYANRTSVPVKDLYNHGTESANNIANRTNLSANARAGLVEARAKMRDMGIDTSSLDQMLGMGATPQPTPPQPTPPQAPPPNIPPEVLAAARSGQPFHMTQAPGQPPVNQPIQPALSPHDQRQAALAESKARAENYVKAQAALPTIELTAMTTLKHIDDLLKHPGLKDVVGFPDNPLALKGYLLPTDAKGFRQRHDQLVGETFLQAYETLKGGGQITEIEGQKATGALNRMDTATSEKDYRQAAEEFKAIIQSTLNNARVAAGKSPLQFDKTNNLIDGSLLPNVPDGTPDELIKARIEKIRAERNSSDSSTANNFLVNKAGGGVEPILNAVSGMIAKPVSDVGGLVATAKDFITGNESGDAQGFKQSVQEALTYSPRTRDGKTVTESPYNPVNIIGNVVGGISHGAGDLVRGENPGILRDAAGNFVQEAIPQAVGILGAGSVKMPHLPKALTENTIVRGIKHLTESVPTRAGRFVNESFGNKKAQAIEMARQKIQDLVPGSSPTFSEITSPLGRAEAAALEDLAGRRYMPSEYGAKSIARNKSYQDALQSIGGRGADDAAYMREIAQRTKVTAPHYAAAEASRASVSIEPVYQMVDGILKAKGNVDSIAIPLRGIRDKLNVKTPIGTSLESRPAQLIALSDDIGQKMSAKTVNGAAEFDVKTLGQIKELLDEQIGKVVPDYAVAKTTYADMSNLPNRMDVGRRLEQTLVPTLNDQGANMSLRREAFTKALSNEQKLIQDSIGFKRGDDLSKILPPSEMQTVQGISSDLGRRANTESLAASGRESIARIIGASVEELPLPPTLRTPVMAAKFAIRKIGSGKSDAAIKLLAKEMLDNPAGVADLMEAATPKQRAALVPYLMNPRLLTVAPSKQEQR